jgi:F-type H+-transporting ATPase subunit delta
VISAVPLEAGHRDRLARYLGELVGKEIELTATVDASIVAGLVARVGDRLIDGSARTRLQDLKKSLAEAAY